MAVMTGKPPSQRNSSNWDRKYLFLVDYTFIYPFINSVIHSSWQILIIFLYFQSEKMVIQATHEHFHWQSHQVDRAMLSGVQQGMESWKRMSLIGYPATNIAVINLPTSLTRCLLSLQILCRTMYLVFKGQLENGKMLNKVKTSLSKFSPKI